MSKTVCIDLDGVLNLYDGWRGEDEFFQPRAGAREFLAELDRQDYRVVIFTTRPAEKAWSWLGTHDLSAYVDDVTNIKPPAIAYIDDRAICFRGDFDDVLSELSEFKTHWE